MPAEIALSYETSCPLPPRRERSELLSRLAPLNPPASGARDVPARSGSECNRRLGEGSGTSRLSELLRPGTGRAPKEGSWAGDSLRGRWKNPLNGERVAGAGRALPLPGGEGRGGRASDCTECSDCQNRFSK